MIIAIVIAIIIAIVIVDNIIIITHHTHTHVIELSLPITFVNRSLYILLT